MIQWTFAGIAPGRHPPDITYCGSSDASTVQEMERDLVAFWTALVEACIVGLSMPGLSPWDCIVVKFEDDGREVRAHSAKNDYVIEEHAIYVGVCFDPRGCLYEIPSYRLFSRQWWAEYDRLEREQARQMFQLKRALLNAVTTEEASAALRRLKQEAVGLRLFLQLGWDESKTIPLNFRLER